MDRPRILGLRHVALLCRNLPRMEAFYRGLLGYRVAWRPDDLNVYLTLGTDDLALHVGEVEEGKGALDHLGMFVPSHADVDAWHAYLVENGVKVKSPPRDHRDGTRSVYVYDPEGNAVQILHMPE